MDPPPCSLAGERGAAGGGERLGLAPDVPEDVRHVVDLHRLEEATTEMTVTKHGY
jgi:hypothetical protein